MIGSTINQFYIQSPSGSNVNPPVPGTMYQVGLVTNTSTNQQPFAENDEFGYCYILINSADFLAAGLPNAGTINGLAINNVPSSIPLPASGWTMENQCLYLGLAPDQTWVGTVVENINQTNGRNTTNWQQVIGNGVNGTSFTNIPNVQQWTNIPFTNSYTYDLIASQMSTLVLKFENRQDPNFRSGGFENSFSWQSPGNQDQCFYNFKQTSYPTQAGIGTFTRPVIQLFIS